MRFRSLAREMEGGGGGDLQTRCLFPHADALFWKLRLFSLLSVHLFTSFCLHPVRGGISIKIVYFYSPLIPTLHLVWGIFLDSPLSDVCLWRGATNKEGFRAVLFQFVSKQVCVTLQGRASEPCILYLCNTASIKRLLYCLLLGLPISDEGLSSMPVNAIRISRLTAVLVMKCRAGIALTWLLFWRLWFTFPIDITCGNLSKNI